MSYIQTKSVILERSTASDDYFHDAFIECFLIIFVHKMAQPLSNVFVSLSATPSKDQLFNTIFSAAKLKIN